MASVRPGPGASRLFDSGLFDSGLFDSGLCDSGLFDSGLFDSIVGVSGRFDSSLGNSGLFDSGPCASGLFDSGLFEMTFEQAVAFLVFAVVAAGTPGPSNALLTATGANVGVTRGLPALFGVAVGMGLMMFLVAFGLGSLLLDNPFVLTGVRWVGAAVLGWLAWKIATAGPPSPSNSRRPIGFAGAAAFQWINPKSWLIGASAAATFLDRGAGSALAQSATIGVLFALAALPSCLPWLAFGALLQRYLRSVRAYRIFNVTMGALLAASVILILY